MKNELELVQRIIEHIRTNRLTKTIALEDLAESYANLCALLNNRLMKCQEFLQKGMRSEAIHEAKVSPALLELVVIVQFQEFNRWRNICQELDMPIPSQIMIDVVERLRSELPMEEELDPLLKQYRRAVHHGETRDSMTILRKIIQIDANNNVWAENLAALEDEYYDSQLADIDDSLAINDLSSLKEYYEDAIHPTRTLPFPVDILLKVRKALLAEQTAELAKQAEDMAAKLRSYISQKRVDMIKPLLENWAALNNNDAFEPQAEHLALIAQANGVLQDEKKELAEKQRIEKKLDNLRAAIAPQNPNKEDIAVALEDVRNEQIKLTEDMEIAIEEAYGRIAAVKQKRNRTIIMAAMTAGSLALVVLGFAYYKISENNNLKQEIISIKNLYDKNLYLEAEARAEEALSKYNIIINNDEFVELQTNITNKIRIEKQGKDRYSVLMQELSSLKERNYNEKINVVASMIEEAKTCAGITDVQKKIVIDWEKDWKIHAELLSEKTSKEIRDICFKAEDITIKAERSNTSIRMKTSIEELKKSLTILSEARPKLELVSVDLKAKFDKICDKHNTIIRDLENKIAHITQETKDYSSLKRRIEQEGLEGDLAKLGSLLDDFVKKFPNAPETSYYSRLINQLSNYEEALFLGNESFMNIRHTKAIQIAEKRTKNPSNDSLWQEDLESWYNFIQSGTRIKNLALGFGEDAISKKDYENLFAVGMIRYRQKGAKEWRSLFFPIVDGNTLNSRKEFDSANRQIERYWLKEIFTTPKDGDGKRISRSHSSILFGNSWTSSHYEINTEDFRKATEGFATLTNPPREFYEKFCLEIEKQNDYEEFLCSKIKEAAVSAITDKTYAASYAALIKYWVSCLEKGTTQKGIASSYRELSKLTNKWNCDYAWFEVENYKIAALRSLLTNDMDKVITKINEISSERKKMIQLNSYALSRKVKVAGMIDYNSDGDTIILDAKLMSIDTKSEIWIMNISGEQYFRAVGVRENGVIHIKDEVLSTLKPGQILFSPTYSDHRIEGIKGDGIKYVPSSWPRK